MIDISDPGDADSLTAKFTPINGRDPSVKPSSRAPRCYWVGDRNLIREPKRSSGVFWVVIVLIITLVGLVAVNGGANIRFHSTSHFDLNAAKA